MKMVVCKACSQAYPANLEYFHAQPKSRKKNGLDSWCKDCKNLLRAQQIAKRHTEDSVFREDRKARQRTRNFNNKINVLSHYGGGIPHCSCCNESNIYFLTVDHINNDGNIHRKNINMRSGTSFYSWIIKHNYPNDLQVLCFNCNRGKATLGYCPHQADETS